MTAAQALAPSPETADGDGEPPTSAEIAALLAAVLTRLRERGPFFRAAVDAVMADLQAEGGE